MKKPNNGASAASGTQIFSGCRIFLKIFQKILSSKKFPRKTCPKLCSYGKESISNLRYNEITKLKGGKT